MASVRKVSVMAVLAMCLSACASSAGFVATWKAPDAQPLELRGTKVAAVVMMSNEASRRAAEDTLAREISARGATGVAMYTILPGAKPENEAEARAAMEQAGVSGAVVMRPVGVEKEVSSTPVTYSAPAYRGYWGGYYGHGWGSTWGPSAMSGGDIRTDTIVVVETLVYSLKQNKLVWGGQSRTINPKNVDQLVRKLAGAVTKELQEQGLIAAPTAG
jgi:hypothetical protein